MLFYSPSTRGFYDDGFHVTIPDDKMEVAADQYGALMQGQAEGQEIVPGPGGAPALAAPPVDLSTYARMKQMALAGGGFTATVGGQPVTFATDPGSELRMTAKSLRLQQPSASTANFTWPSAAGAPVSLAPADLISTAEKIADFVQATSDLLLLTIIPGIENGTISTAAAIDTAAWPSNHD